MRLYEMGSLPKKAGVATLEFKDVGQPTRKEDKITLPADHSKVEFFPILEGEQFLLVLGGYTPSVFFGGTDEQPFLTQLEPKAFGHFIKGGVPGLFEALKPKLIRDLEAQLDPRLTVRQGDIFAFPVAKTAARKITWRELVDQSWDEGKAVSLVSGKRNLFETRHSITGKGATISNTRFVEGLLEAPDHEPRVLDGPHYVAQAELLHNPKLAD